MLKYNKKVLKETEEISGSIVSRYGKDTDYIDPSGGTYSERISFYADDDTNEIKADKIKRDAKNIEFGMSLPNEITMINVNYLINRERGLSPYTHLGKEDMLLMKSSLEKCGLIHPLIVFKIHDTKYMVIDGENRGACLSEMFDETGNTRYENIPCIVLTKDKFSHLDLREICINANLNKKCSGNTQRALILMMHGIYRRRYTRLKEINVAREIAGKLNVSISTVYNYLKLGNLCVLAQDFLNMGRIDLTSAKKLANLSQELQMLIIKEIGEENISDHFIKGAVHKNTDMKTYKAQVRNVLNWRHPHKYSIKISGKYKEMEIIETMLTKYFSDNVFMFRKTAKMQVIGKCFDFMSGLACFGEREMRIPEFFQEFIKNGEIGEYYPDIKTSKKGVINKETVLLKNIEGAKNPEELEKSQIPQNQVSQSQSENEEELNEVVIDYKDLFKYKKSKDEEK